MNPSSRSGRQADPNGGSARAGYCCSTHPICRRAGHGSSSDARLDTNLASIVRDDTKLVQRSAVRVSELLTCVRPFALAERSDGGCDTVEALLGALHGVAAAQEAVDESCLFLPPCLAAGDQDTVAVGFTV